MRCRHCQKELSLPFIDLGAAPPSNAYLHDQNLRAPEQYFPLRVMVCNDCWLVQTEDYAGAETLFTRDYAYFSSYSSSWLEHAKNYVEVMRERFGINSDSMVVEIAANDGYLLQYVKNSGIPCLGIEPTYSTAAAARAKGIPIVEDFFGRRLAARLAREGFQADLAVANNVLAHVPDINDFVAGFAALLKPAGVATFEFPHLQRLVAGNQFDTVYHEHFSYLSLTAVVKIFKCNGLVVFDVQELPTHGGSLRVYAQRINGGHQPLDSSVDALLSCEALAGMTTCEYYESFQGAAERIKDEVLDFLIQAKRKGQKVAAYGAAAKGNTLLNFAGVRPDLISFVVDRSPSKLGRYLPGSRIPIVAEECLREARPDYVVILPWNIREEIVTQLDYVRSWGGKLVVAVPCLEVF